MPDYFTCPNCLTKSPVSLWPRLGMLRFIKPDATYMRECPGCGQVPQGGARSLVALADEKEAKR